MEMEKGDMKNSIHKTSDVQNVTLGKSVKISKRCSVFGSEERKLIIGDYSYIGMNAFVNGFSEQLTIGSHVSIAQNVCIMTDSGPNASLEMQKFYDLEVGPVSIGDHSWVCANVVILPNVTIGAFCVVAANSVVTESFPDYSVIAGSPAKLVKRLQEKNEL